MELNYKKVEKIVNSVDKLSKEEIIKYNDIVTTEYNKITEPYRIVFMKLEKLKEEEEKRKREKCNHCFTKYSEYHNESYYICDNCGYEK